MKSTFYYLCVFISVCLVLAACGGSATFDTQTIALSTTPQAVYTTTPTYPRKLAQEGIEGYVTLEFGLNGSGRVIDPIVISSSEPEFEEAALASVQQWVFDISQLTEEARLQRHTVRLDFKLED